MRSPTGGRFCGKKGTSGGRGEAEVHELIFECKRKVKEMQTSNKKKFFPFTIEDLDKMLEHDNFKAEFNRHLAEREFSMVHHFRGTREYGLDEAIMEEATNRGVRVLCEGGDNKRNGVDLLANQPYNDHLAKANLGLLDSYWSGYPCTSFSRLRFRWAPGMPGPVRDRDNPYGLPDNSWWQQQEADRGTSMAARSTDILVAMEESEKRRIAPTVGGIENPQRSR